MQEKKNNSIKKTIIKEDDISLILDAYEDIFSDFDPRSYHEKTLSIDFLREAKRATIEKQGKTDLIFLIPKEVKNPKIETIIKKRLGEYFQKHYYFLSKELRKMIFNGTWFIASGLLLMFIATFILTHSPSSNFLTNFLIILLEPGGWFLFWEGLGLVLFESKKKKPDLTFYKKMSTARINFNPY